MPFATKRSKELKDSKLGANQRAQQASILQALSQHIRFATMSKDYFVAAARPYLSVEVSEAILMFHLLGQEPPGQLLSKRVGLQPVERLQPASFKSKNAHGDAEKLSIGRGTWKPTSNDSELEIHVQKDIYMSELRLTFAAEGHIWIGKVLRPTFNKNGSFVEQKYKEKKNGRMRTMVFEDIQFLTSPSSRKISVTNPSGQAWETSAELVNIEVFGKKSLGDHALEVVQQLSSNLVLEKP